MEMLVKKNPIMKEVYDEYNKFVNTKDLWEELFWYIGIKWRKNKRERRRS